MQSDYVIEAENLAKCYHIYSRPHDRLLQMFLRNRRTLYRQFWALNDVSFAVKKSGAFGVIGRNGSGKSTLLQIVCGTLSPTRGTITTSGRIAALLELGSGFNPEFTGRENIYLNAAVLGLPKEVIDERFTQIATFADIGDFIEQPVKTYSSGMYMRLAFAVAAHVDADILVIDEALAVGDALFVQKCMRFLREFKERGTLLFVSHDTGAVTGLCEKAIWLHNGALVAQGEAKEVSEQYLAFLYDKDESRLSASTPKINEKAQRGLSSERANNLRYRDVRSDFINSSALKNDIKVFDFQPGVSAEFGSRSAQIQKVELRGSSGTRLVQVIGGEEVTVRIEVQALADLESPIVGFSFKDRLGQVLFGDNTYLSHKSAAINVPGGKKLIAEFKFTMPILPVGDYTVSAAIATGTQENHIQQHWIHDALVVKSLSSSVSTGLVGIPMLHIELSAVSD